MAIKMAAAAAVITVSAASAMAAPALGANDPLRICFIDDFSGAAGDAGKEAFGGLQIAMEPTVAAGGINGRKVEVIRYDGKTDPTLTASFATRCAEDDKALMIIGGNPSVAAPSMIPVASQFKIPYYMLAASSDNLMDPPARWHFRFGAANRQDALAIADFVVSNGFKRVAIINNQVPFGIDGAKAIGAALEKKGIKPFPPQTYDVSATDVSPQVLNVKEQKPDIVIMYSYPADAARVMRTIKQLGVNVPVIATRIGIMPATRKLAGEASDGTLSNTTADMSRADVRKFFATYNSKFSPPIESSFLALLGHDAAALAMQVLGTSEVQKAINGGTLPEIRTAIRDATEKYGGSFKGLQGKQGAAYQFSSTQHHGPSDENWTVFAQVAEKGTRLVVPDLSKIRPRP
jgi:branched-chain amino acid transport system substrate-binding protein